MEQHGFMNVSKLLHCGVYALVRRGEVVYVGKSRRPLVRLYAHMNARGKKMPWKAGYNKEYTGIHFDAIWFLPCMLGQLDTLEVHFIKTFAPKHNTKDKPRHVAEPGLKPTRVPVEIMPIPEDMKELLRQLVVISDLPPPEQEAPRGPYIMRRL